LLPFGDEPHRAVLHAADDGVVFVLSPEAGQPGLL